MDFSVTSGFIDHIIMLHGDWRIAEQRRGRGLVVYEEKVLVGHGVILTALAILTHMVLQDH